MGIQKSVLVLPTDSTKWTEEDKLAKGGEINTSISAKARATRLRGYLSVAPTAAVQLLQQHITVQEDINCNRPTLETQYLAINIQETTNPQ
jgi:hypothetical protein